MRIPIYLVNRDLLSPLAGMVEYFARCEAAGPIIVVDCDSTYPPLLDWYARHAADLEIRREPNRGCRAAFQVDGPRGDFYLSSDADLDLSGVPLDCLARLRDGMRAYGDRFSLAKTALSLRIDDLPEAGLLTERVRREQLACWRERIGPWFLADTDTTAALYRGNTGWGGYRSFRLGPPYSARHLAWYLDPAALPEEWSWYFGRINPDESLWGRTLNFLTRPQ
ncbi:MAG: hypothetical protein E6Q97_24455 [Desulfurellales bacterium]|nr:MAG: hypothetical protein E6Q97_24455 [Desulfurellales bacterium]